MAHNPQIFVASFFLQTNNKGFSLHKIKHNGISSTFKFKSKINNARNMKDKTLTSFFQEDVVIKKSHRNTNERLQSDEKIKSLNLNLLENLTKQKYRLTNMENRYRNRLNSVIFQPKFPEIKNKKMSVALNQIKNGEATQEQIMQKNQENQQQNSRNNTVQVNFGQDLKNIQKLIKKQVLKTQNQAILRQNQIKLDETQINYPHKVNKKKSITITKKRRKKIQRFQQMDIGQKKRSIEKVIQMQGPKVTKCDTSKIRLLQTLYPRQKRESNKVHKTIKFSKDIRDHAQKQPPNPVQGWQNQFLSQSSQLFQANLIPQEEKIQKKIFFVHSQRLK